MKIFPLYQHHEDSVESIGFALSHGQNQMRLEIHRYANLGDSEPDCLIVATIPDPKAVPVTVFVQGHGLDETMNEFRLKAGGRITSCLSARP